MSDCTMVCATVLYTRILLICIRLECSGIVLRLSELSLRGHVYLVTRSSQDQVQPYTNIPSHPPPPPYLFFVLRFAIQIIHRSGRVGNAREHLSCEMSGGCGGGGGGGE